MKLTHKKDFVYEFSDLNLLQTRVQVLRGNYKGMIVEFGGSLLSTKAGKRGGEFSFDFKLYRLPDEYPHAKMRVDDTVRRFLSNLLIAVVGDRHADKDALKKVQGAAEMRTSSQIKIDPSFYSGASRVEVV